jgi:hypothetical protein
MLDRTSQTLCPLTNAGTNIVMRNTRPLNTPLTLLIKDTASGFVTTTHHAFMMLGISAIGLLAVMFVHPEIANHLKLRLPFTSISTTSPETLSNHAYQANSVSIAGNTTTPPTGSAAYLANAHRFGFIAPTTNGFNDSPSTIKQERASAATLRQQALVTNWLAKKYRVANDATDMLVSAAYATAKDIKLDPLLILSVMAIESGFNPFAESPVGAQGLMQVMSKVHHEKFRPLGGVKAALNPVANIKVGSLILKDYVSRGGSVEAGLKLYVGAAAFDTDFGYGSKVIAEYRRLKAVATGKNVSMTTQTLAAKIKSPESKVAAPLATPSDTTAAPITSDTKAEVPEVATTPAQTVQPPAEQASEDANKVAAI